MSNTPPKLDAINKKGKMLFWKHGLKRVSIEEICREAKVSKMTFYKFYPNKIALAHTILSNIYETSLKEFKAIVAAEIDFTKKLEQLFLLKQKSSKGISREFIMDLTNIKNNDLINLMKEKGEESLQIFVDFLIQSQQQNLIRSDIKLDFILYHLNQMNLIFENTELMAQYDTPEDLIMESMRFLFYGIGAKNE